MHQESALSHTHCCSATKPNPSENDGPQLCSGFGACIVCGHGPSTIGHAPTRQWGTNSALAMAGRAIGVEGKCDLQSRLTPPVAPHTLRQLASWFPCAILNTHDNMVVTIKTTLKKKSGLTPPVAPHTLRQPPSSCHTHDNIGLSQSKQL